jgi:hypothetical protein
MPVRGKGSDDLMSNKAWKTHLFALLRVERSSGQPEYTLVAVKVRQISPESNVP